MSFQAPCVRDLDPAHDQLPSFNHSMNVITDAHVHHPRNIGTPLSLASRRPIAPPPFRVFGVFRGSKCSSSNPFPRIRRISRFKMFFLESLSAYSAYFA